MPQAVIYLAGVLTIIYGYREKHRTRFNECRQFRFCPLKLVMLLVKTFIFLVDLLAFVISIACFGFALTVYVALYASNEACQAGSTAATIILETITNDDAWNQLDDGFVFDDDAYQELCQQVQKSVNSAEDATIGGVVLLGGQVAVLAYYFKYSTLSLVSPYEFDAPT